MAEFWCKFDKFLAESLERWRVAAGDAEKTCPGTVAAKVTREMHEGYRAMYRRRRRVVPFVPPPPNT